MTGCLIFLLIPVLYKRCFKMTLIEAKAELCWFYHKDVLYSTSVDRVLTSLLYVREGGTVINDFFFLFFNGH